MCKCPSGGCDSCYHKREIDDWILSAHCAFSSHEREHSKRLTLGGAPRSHPRRGAYGHAESLLKLEAREIQDLSLAERVCHPPNEQEQTLASRLRSTVLTNLCHWRYRRSLSCSQRGHSPTITLKSAGKRPCGKGTQICQNWALINP